MVAEVARGPLPLKESRSAKLASTSTSRNQFSLQVTAKAQDLKRRTTTCKPRLASRKFYATWISSRHRRQSPYFRVALIRMNLKFNNSNRPCSRQVVRSLRRIWAASHSARALPIRVEESMWATSMQALIVAAKVRRQMPMQRWVPFSQSMVGLALKVALTSRAT